MKKMSRISNNPEELLAYFSYLQCMEENSAYMYRIQYAQYALLLQMKGKKRVDFKTLESILVDGNPMMGDDPQENIFVDCVHSVSHGSYMVFSGLFLNEQASLTRLLTIAALKLKINDKFLNKVWFLLELSSELATKFGYNRYVCGCPESESPTFPTVEEFKENESRLFYTASEINTRLCRYGISNNEFAKWLFTAHNRDIKKELHESGICTLIEKQPFYRCSDTGILLLQPSALLHCAIVEVVDVLKRHAGEGVMYAVLQDMMKNEIGFELQNHNNCFEEGKIDGIDYLWAQFDSDKAANIMFSVLDANPNLQKVTEALNANILSKHPETNILNVYVIDQLNESLGYYPVFRSDSVVLKADDLLMFLHQKDFNLMKLYYYSIDKQRQGFVPTVAEKDKIAYYIDHKYSFYQDDIPTFFHVMPDFAQRMKWEYTQSVDMHDASWNNCNVRLVRFADMPVCVPVYCLTMSDCNAIVCELSGGRLFFNRISKDPEYKTIEREVIISLSNWFYGLERRFGVQLLKKDVTLHISFFERGALGSFKGDDSNCCVSIPLSFFNRDIFDVEPCLIKEMCRQLIKLGYMLDVVCDQMVDDMFDEAGNGRFMQVMTQHDDPRCLPDNKTTMCYFLDERWVDKVLDDVAAHVNRKGTEVKLTMQESKTLLVDVIVYLQNSALALIREFDTEYLVKSLLELYHGVVYWSALSNKRFQSIDLAYRYIGARFEHQAEYINNYDEIKVLAQGIVEYLFINQIHESKVIAGSAEKIDHLFALMHHILDFSACLDAVNRKVKGSELGILPNGRLIFPREAIDVTNRYFGHLRQIRMEHPDWQYELHEKLPQYIFNPEEDDFKYAFSTEYGFEYGKLNNIISNSVRYATDQGNAVMILPEEMFVADVIAGELSSEEYNTFKDSFVLSTAQNLATLETHEMFIQHFNRVTQFSNRPWLLYQGNIMFSTKALSESVLVFMERVSNGTLKCKTQQMIDFMAEVNNRKGHLFNDSLLALFQDNAPADLVAVEEVPMKPGVKLNTPTDFGDLDVLLIYPSLKKIICIEAKNYYEARTLYELTGQNINIEKGLKKANRRDTWCKANRLAFKHYCPLVDESYEVLTKYVTYFEPAYRYFEHEKEYDIKVLSAMELVHDKNIILN